VLDMRRKIDWIEFSKGVDELEKGISRVKSRLRETRMMVEECLWPDRRRKEHSAPDPHPYEKSKTKKAMSDVNTKTTAPRQNQSGLHNDFSEQEETMTNGAMPPQFALEASPADGNPGNSKGGMEIHVQGVPPELVALLVKHEGVVFKSYPDNGHVSAGLGHLLKTEEEKTKYPEGTAVPRWQVEEWARKDVGEAWKAGQKQAKMLGVDSHEFKVALASMSFQNGVNWYTEHQDTWELMKGHHWELAAIEAARSDWALQTPPRLHDFQAALRKLAGITEPQSLAETFKGMAAEANEMSGAKNPTVRPPANPTSAKVGTVSSPLSPDKARQVQTKLKELGLYSGAIDGKEFRTNGTESNTTKGIKDFQRSKELPVTGQMDDKTWEAMFGAKPDNGSLWERLKAKADAKMKAEANKPKPERGWGSEPKPKDDGFEGTGNFMDDSNFISQLDSSPWASKNNPGGGKCRKVATEMLLRYLSTEKPDMLETLGLFSYIKDPTSVADLTVKGNFLRIMEEDKSHIQDMNQEDEHDHFKKDEWLVDHEQAEASIAYIDSYLKRNIPVLVGVDHTYNRKLSLVKGVASKASKTGLGYNEGTTDHFITLSGIGKDEQGRKYYSFFDPGRTNISQGSASNVKNRLVHIGGTRFKAEGTGSRDSEDFHLAMVVLFPADRERFASEREKNYSSWID
jgi:hypothetical protein